MACQRRSGASEHGGLVIAWRPSVSACLSISVFFKFFLVCFFVLIMEMKKRISLELRSRKPAEVRNYTARASSNRRHDAAENTRYLCPRELLPTF